MRIASRWPALSFLSLCFCALAVASPARAADWIHWRGPEQNGVSRDTNLPDKWSPAKPGANNLIWKQPFGCRSTPLVMNGRVYLINAAGEGVGEQERVMCLEAATGKPVWEYRFNVWHAEIASSRVGWTNLTADPETGHIYAHGTQGLLLCFDKDGDGKGGGKVIWSRSLTEEFGRVSGYGGRLVSPLVDGDLVIVGMLNASWGDQGRGGNRYVAFDKKTGQVVWWATLPGKFHVTYYSCPVVTVINGQRLYLTGGSDGGLHAIKVRTGEVVWSYFFANGSINSSPVVAGNLVYCTHGEENLDTNAQGRVICVDASKLVDRLEGGKVVGKQPTLVWEYNKGLKAGYTTPVLVNDRLYVCDDSAQMYCFDAKTGAQVWKRRHNYGRLARGSAVYGDGKLYIFDVNARFHILKPDEKGCTELQSTFFRTREGQTGFVECNGTPAISNGRVYFATLDECFCIGKPDWKGPSPTPPPPPVEPPANPNAQPTHLQIYPTEVTLHPGQSLTFKARLFDGDGRFLKEEKAAWTLPLPTPPPPPPGGKPTQPPALKGTIDADGKLTVDKVPPAQQAYVDAKVGGLTGRARVRVAPVLPFAPDFNKLPIGGFIPGSVNCQGKFAIVELDGTKVLKKLATSSAPPLARANAYLGQPDLTNYTIQADIRATRKNGFISDAGIVANRYTFLLGGQKQELRIISWEVQKRVDKTIEFSWKPDTWYTLKLTVDVQDKQAVVRGKVWERGQPEPDKWTLEFTDPNPNREGSPALYGYAQGVLEGTTGAEIFYDKVSVTPNDGKK